MKGLDLWHSQMTVQDIHRTRGWMRLHQPVDQRLSARKIPLGPWDDEYKRVCFEYTKGLVEYYDTLTLRDMGEHEFVGEYFKDESEAALTTAHPQQPQPQGPALSEVFKRYSAERIKGGEWKPRTQKQNEENFRWLSDHFGDVPIDSIDGDKMRGFKEMLMEATTRNATKNPKPLAPRTINNVLIAASALFNYAKANKYIRENPAEGLSIKMKKGKGASYDKFTMDDLGRIFTVEGLDGRNNTKLWRFGFLS